MRRSTLLLLAICLWIAPAGAGEDPPQSPVEQALRKPPATGLLVTFVADDSQARRLGVYLVETLAALMPHEAQACWHFRSLDEGLGTVDLPSALFVAGKESIEHAGAQQDAWRVELRKLGTGTTSTFWVAGDRRVLRVDYGGAFGHLDTKARVLAGLPDTVVPQTRAPKEAPR